MRNGNMEFNFRGTPVEITTIYHHGSKFINIKYNGKESFLNREKNDIETDYVSEEDITDFIDSKCYFADMFLILTEALNHFDHCEW